MKMHMRVVTAVALFGAMLASASYAVESTDDKSSAESFKRLDVDGNGLLTAEEADADIKVADEFPHSDIDGDGLINLDEFSKMKFSDE